MKCRLKCENPGSIEYTLTVTQTAEHWEKLRDQLDKAPYGWPSCELVRAINDLLGQARKIYWPAESAEPEGAAHGQ